MRIPPTTQEDYILDYTATLPRAVNMRGKGAGMQL